MCRSRRPGPNSRLCIIGRPPCRVNRRKGEFRLYFAASSGLEMTPGGALKMVPKAGVNRAAQVRTSTPAPAGALIKDGAEGGTRTRTSIAHYPLKIACLPIPPLRLVTTYPALAGPFRALPPLVHPARSPAAPVPVPAPRALPRPVFPGRGRWRRPISGWRAMPG